MKTLSYNMTPEGLSRLLRDMRAAGYTVQRDRSAGTATASLPPFGIVLRAIQIGKGWLVRADPRCVKVEENPTVEFPS